jgi:transcriptional regulator with XRE-family HTH domain
MSERLAAARKRIAGRSENAKVMSLAAMRLNAGLSQKQLADAVGSAQPNVSLWESGMREPSLSTVAKLARVLNVSADDIVAALVSND